MRSDAARNRETLLDAATRVFAAAEGDRPTMRGVAREAGVGVATLYRHFPTYEALVDAVYEDQARRLSEGAARLSASLPPAEALRNWMDLFGEWIATKRGMLGTLLAAEAAGSHPQSRTAMLAAITSMLDAGRAAGVLRADVDAEDVSASLVGIFTVAGATHRHDQAARLLDLLMDAMVVR